jgi:hypothetical protein
VKSGKYEHLAVFIDKTPYMNISAGEINAIIDSLGEKKNYSNIHVYINNEKTEYPLRENKEFKSKLTDKETTVKNIAYTLFSYKSNSVKSIFITDRSFKRFNLETDIIVKRNAPKVLITDISGFVTLFSSSEILSEVSFKDKEGRISGTVVKLKKGVNKIKPPINEFVSVNCLYDSIEFEKEVILSQVIVCDKTKNIFIQRALKALEIPISENSDIEITVNEKTERGIVFSNKNERKTKKSDLFSTDDGFDLSIDDMNRNLEYISLYETKGRPLIASKSGEVLLSKSNDVYYVGLPIDTSKSNFVLTPSFVVLMDYMINELSGAKGEIISAELEYRSDLTMPCADHVSGYEPVKERDISFVFLIAASLLLLILIFT